jgi:glycosyltransferase involved in cell wall biosynthesis
MKKIAIDCRLLDIQKNTGISRYTEYMINYYIDRFGEDGVLIVSNVCTKYTRIEHAITDLKPFSIYGFLKFRKFLSGLDICLYHSPFYSSVHRKIEGLKTILTVHDLMYRILPDFFSDNKFINMLARFYYELIVRASICASDKVVAVSAITAKDLKDIFNVDALIIPENSSIKVSADFSITEKNNLNCKGYYFYCGNARRHKNIDFISEVFAKNQDLPPLVLAGHGHKRIKNVMCVGVVWDVELRALYENAIAFIFPSKYEGFGLPILEALNAGGQIVASKIPAFLEFNTPSIHFFTLENESEFLSALISAKNNPKETAADFFADYSDEFIYSRFNEMLLDFGSLRPKGLDSIDKRDLS